MWQLPCHLFLTWFPLDLLWQGKSKGEIASLQAGVAPTFSLPPYGRNRKNHVNLSTKKMGVILKGRQDFHLFVPHIKSSSLWNRDHCWVLAGFRLPFPWTGMIGKGACIPLRGSSVQGGKSIGLGSGTPKFKFWLCISMFIQFLHLWNEVYNPNFLGQLWKVKYHM